jgi:N utilization substance protein B
LARKKFVILQPFLQQTMINRNTIRVKVMQAIYGYNLSETQNVDTALKDLMNSFEDMYLLYIRLISIFSTLRDTAEQIIELKKQKYLPTETDLSPNLKFVNNIFIHKIEENKSLQSYINEHKTGWDNDVDLLFVRKLYTLISQKDFFIEYMQRPDNSFETDKKLVLDILEKFMLENEEMIHYFGDIKLCWQHDYNDVVIMVYNTLHSFTQAQSNNSSLPPLFKIVKGGVSEDMYFAHELLLKTLKNEEQYTQIVSKKIFNWETERIACIDFILLKMAICEFCEFPSIPLRVTLNEYIEISKYYSTPKSRYFINGLLDSILETLKKENKINKQGRGLMG